MQTHADILDQKEAVGKPLLASLIFHALIVATVASYGLLNLGSTEKWGDPHSLGGGAVGITPVKAINLPSNQGRINPLANDTQSQIPAAPKTPAKAEPKVDPNAVKLKSKAELKKLAEQFEKQHKFTPRDYNPNQVFTKSGQAVSSPMFTAKPGGGGVGSGSTSPLGSRFGAYEQILRDIVARNWRTEGLSANQIPTPAIVTFVLTRNGAVQNAKIAQSSGNYTMDQSALRASQISSPFPPLPPQYEHESANLEFWFHLQK
jgi:TonB family protein